MSLYPFDYKLLSTVPSQKKAFGGFGAVFLLLVFVVLIVYKKRHARPRFLNNNRAAIRGGARAPYGSRFKSQKAEQAGYALVDGEHARVEHEVGMLGSLKRR